MRIEDLTNEDFFGLLEAELTTYYSEITMRTITNFDNTYQMKSSDQKIISGEGEYQFPITAELYPVYEWVIGQNDKPFDAEEVLQSICEMVWHNPFTPGGHYDVNWEEWSETRLGFLVQTAYKKLDLEKGNSLTATDLAQLSGLSLTGILGKIPDEIEAEKENGNWVISSEEARRFLEDRETAIIRR